MSATMQTLSYVLLYLAGAVAWIGILGSIFYAALSQPETASDRALNGPDGAAKSSLRMRPSIYGAGF